MGDGEAFYHSQGSGPAVVILFRRGGLVTQAHQAAPYLAGDQTLRSLL